MGRREGEREEATRERVGRIVKGERNEEEERGGRCKGVVSRRKVKEKKMRMMYIPVQYSCQVKHRGTD